MRGEMVPKLAKKHRTFDCDLSSSTILTPPLAQTQPQPSSQPRPRPPIPTRLSQTQTTATQLAHQTNVTMMPNHHHRHHHHDDDDDDTRQQQHETLPSSSSISTPPKPPLNHQLEPHETKPTNSVGVERERPNENVAPAAADSSNCLSKLVLSSSMHQLADSKFHTNYHLNHNNNFNSAIPTTTMTNNNNLGDDDNCDDRMDDDDDNATSTTTTPTRTLKSTTTTTPNKINNNNESTTSNTNTNSTTTTPNSKSNQRQKLQQQQQLHLQRQQREANLDTVHVVVGNESCDLDSAVSCLLMFHIISKMSDEINGKDKTRTLYIPLLNTTRDMLDSKCEVLWFLQKTLNIDKSFLTCKDDIDWNEIKKNGVEVLITLVDHNYNEEFKDIGRIVEIIDHHQIQNPEWLMENHANLRLTLDTSVGSCTTLVAERLFYIYAEHHVSDEILLLIYGTVLLDTICLSEKAKRFTRRDVYLLKKLDYLLGSKKPVRDELYKQLVDIKNSFRELNFEKLMKHDLKVYKDKTGQRVGIASLFGMAAREALGLAANIDLDLFFQQNQYEAFIIMGLIADLDHSDSISRDLVLISANKHLFEQLRGAFEADTSKLDLVPISGSDSNPDPEDNIINNKRIVDSSNDCGPLYKARIWLQRNVTSSRKVVAPLVLKVLHDNSSAPSQPQHPQ